MRRSAAVLLLMAAAFGPARGEDMTYGDCTAMVERSPATAERKAADWLTHGGGPGAMHCRAMALFELKRYDEAARIFDTLARNHDLDRKERSALSGQAASSWLQAGHMRDALQSYNAALADNPGDQGLLIDRAAARGLVKDWKGAEADLSAALTQDANRADLLVLRASARWAMDHKADAASDIVRALEVYPDYPAALLERGKMKYSAGDVKGARKDWQIAANRGRGETAADAKRYLAESAGKR